MNAFMIIGGERGEVLLEKDMTVFIDIKSYD